MRDWIQEIDNDHVASALEKQKRFEQFVQDLTIKLRDRLQQQVDHDTQVRISQALGNDRDTIEKILGVGRNGVGHFGFIIRGVGIVYADGGGLYQFLAKMKEIEAQFGADALVDHLIDGDFKKYFGEIFANTQSGDLLDHWVQELDKDKVTPLPEKMKRFEHFVEGLVTELQNQLHQNPPVSAAMTIEPGGIKFGHIDLEHQGRMTTDLVTEKAFENMLLKAKGLTGLIVGITRIPNLLQFIQ